MAENPRIEELRRRVQADPASIAFAALAEEFRRVGRNEDAIDTCRTGLQRHPAYLSARVTLGRALIETGDYEGAREELETVLRSAPENLAAIRGLATIHERLGHSTEMDPHLADIMKGHAESIRLTVKPPPPEPVYVPEPIVVAPIAVEHVIPVEPEPQFKPEPGSDPFQIESGFLSAPKFQPAPDFRPAPAFPAFAPEPQFQAKPEFESSPQPEWEPQFEAQPEADPAPHPQPSFEDNPLGDAAPRTEPELDLSIAPPLGGSPAPDLDLGMMLDAEPEVYAAAGPGPEMLEAEPEFATAAGPDPEMLATLARLERFLGAIQSLRA